MNFENIKLLFKYKKISFGRHIVGNPFPKSLKYMYSLTYLTIFIQILANIYLTYSVTNPDSFVPVYCIHFSYILILWTILPVTIMNGSFHEIHENTDRMRLFPLRKVELYFYKNGSLFLHPYFHFLLLVDLVVFSPLFFTHFSLFLILVFLSSHLFLFSFVLLLYNLIPLTGSLAANIVKIFPFVLLVMNYNFTVSENKIYLSLFSSRLDFSAIYDRYLKKIVNYYLAERALMEISLLVLTGFFVLTSFYFFGRRKVFLRSRNRLAGKKRISFSSLLYLELQSTIYNGLLKKILAASVLLAVYLFFADGTETSYIVSESLLLFLLHKYAFNSIAGNESPPRYFLLPIPYEKMVNTKNLLLAVLALSVSIPLMAAALLNRQFTVAFYNGTNSLFSICMFCLLGNYFSIYFPSGKADSHQSAPLALFVVLFPAILFYLLLKQNGIIFFAILTFLSVAVVLLYKKRMPSMEKIHGERTEKILGSARK